MTDRPAVREYRFYVRDQTHDGDYRWSEPVTAENARQAVRIFETLGNAARRQIRIVKVVATGELIEVAPLD